MKNRDYKLLKSLPGCVEGEIFKHKKVLGLTDENCYTNPGGVIFRITHVEDNRDWFREIRPYGFRTLKDLPGLKAGSEFIKETDYNGFERYKCGESHEYYNILNDHPDWFEEMAEPK